MLELHVYGPLDNQLSFSPECQAAIWYLALTIGPSNFSVVQSSNTFIAKNGQLPALRTNNTTYGGLYSIIYYLKGDGFDLDSKLPEINKAQCTALSSYITQYGNVCSQYLLFMDKENYEGVMRPLFTRLLPFPMQYNAPGKMRETAKKQCSDYGLGDLDELLENNADTKGPVLNQTHQQVETEKMAERFGCKSSRTAIKIMTLAQDFLFTVMDICKKSSMSDDSIFLFGNMVTTADIVFATHLQALLNPDLPNNFLKPLVESQFPRSVQLHNNFVEKMNSFQITTSTVSPKDAVTLTNTVINNIWG
ncbi:hypothetical protein NADFUDRAFT_65615 [Nadsonia fulvescens var. elongata DSM 6958]|uniref:Mitochondrial outer membrane transport complex Sam37/metaxin N-terminal domain-containing protein n=1 Tax=Nadsonia fulvescens var. elongata DSM 6958 TaxID=857566 RepID=A0A1E3PK13_9ASCO|nr:hypothetical protein NADFUDRAFT_65615 [Nadsonia fulvescens var. elongata DSM 6958]